jgi:hypothetical protein
MKMTLDELSKRYNTTSEIVKQEYYNFIQNEGWLSDGTECVNFDAWMKNRLTIEESSEPFQKGDLNYGL